MSLQARYQSSTSSEIATKGKGTNNKPHFSQSRKVHLEQDGVHTHKQPRESALPRLASRYMTSWPRHRVSTEPKHRPSMQQVPRRQTRRESFQFSAQRAQLRHRQRQKRARKRKTARVTICVEQPRRESHGGRRVTRDRVSGPGAARPS